MELTVNNLYEFLKKSKIKDEILDYFNVDYKIKNFFIKTIEIESNPFELLIKSLLDEFFPNWETIKISKTKISFQNGGSRCYIDHRCGWKIFNNITVLNFKNLYPNIILKLSKEENIEIIDHSEIDPFNEEFWNNEIDGIIWNVPDFFKLYKFIFKNKKELESFNDPIIDKLIRTIINYAYGFLSSSYSSFYAFGMEKVVNISNDIVNIFIKKYPNNTIYADTDEIFFLNFDEIKESVEKDLEEIEFDYYFRKINTLILIDRKKYIESEDYNMKIKGFKKVMYLTHTGVNEY